MYKIENQDEEGIIWGSIDAKDTAGKVFSIEGEVKMQLEKDKVFETLLGGADIPTSIEQNNK